MSAFTIKIIAILLMIVDHVGAFLFPQALLLRGIGRLSFPLFAWLIANGARHTKNINLYLGRLYIFALISQIPYVLAHTSANITSPGFNVLFTLFLGLVAIKFVKENGSKFAQAWVIIFCALAAQLIWSDYGLLGVLSIVFFYLFFDNFKLLLISQIIVYFVIWFLLIGMKVFCLNQVTALEPLALLSLVFVYSYNHKPGPRAKYLFYVFYPLQFVVFYLLLTYAGF